LAAQPGKVSDRQTFRNEGKFGPHFKGQFWKRICEYFRGCENRRHSRGLGWRARVSDRQILDFRVWAGGFAVAVSARHFPISVSACPRPSRSFSGTAGDVGYRFCRSISRMPNRGPNARGCITTLFCAVTNAAEDRFTSATAEERRVAAAHEHPKHAHADQGCRDWIFSNGILE
jgi:hypothetical protein